MNTAIARKTMILTIVAAGLALNWGGAALNAKQASSAPRETQRSFKAANNLDRVGERIARMDDAIEF